MFYLLAISYQSPAQATGQASSVCAETSKGGQMIVRSGYFGLCAQDGEHGALLCANGLFGLQSVLGGSNTDPLDANGVASHFKDDVVFPGLL